MRARLLAALLVLTGVVWAEQGDTPVLRFPTPVAVPLAPCADILCSDFQSTLIEDTCIEGTLIVGGPCAAAAAAPAGPAATSEGLVASWPLGEQSGARYEDLTRDRRAGDFELDNSEHLSIADGAQSGLDPSAWTLVAWVNIESAVTGAIGKWQTGNFANSQYSIQYNNVNFTCWMASDAAGASKTHPTLNPGLDAWHMLACSFDGADTGAEIGAAADGGGWQTSASALVQDTTTATAFRVGYDGGSKSDGRIASVGVWSAKIADAVLATLYNSGLGKQYTDLTSTEKTSLISYWDLDEFSGSRIDSHGSNDLTDNNTVTWGDGVNLTLTEAGLRGGEHRVLRGGGSVQPSRRGLRLGWLDHLRATAWRWGVQHRGRSVDR